MVYIIAEAGVNHCGSLNKALQLVDAANDVGADAAKFQMFTADTLVNKDRDPEQWAKLKELELPFDVFRQIRDRCAVVGIDFMATPFSLDAMGAYADLGARTVKIASPDLHYSFMLTRAGATFDHVILSTGASYPAQIARALEHIGPRAHVTLLHCVSAYPTPVEDMNLRAMATLREKFPQCDVGLSDHVDNWPTATPVMATAMGASVIEKHIGLNADCPDAAVSLDPGEFHEMVTAIRWAEDAMGDGIKRPMPSEMAGINRARRGLDDLRPMVKP